MIFLVISSQKMSSISFEIWNLKISYKFWTEISNSVHSDIFECVITPATSYVISIAVYYELQRWSVSKPSLKFETAKRHLLELSWLIYSLGSKLYIFLYTFLLFKIEIWNFQYLFEKYFVKPYKISTPSAYSDNFYIHVFYLFSDLIRSPREYQKMAFAVLIFSEGFGLSACSSIKGLGTIRKIRLQNL